ncbi:MAG: thiamine diphosphokinase [Termitinemataceae bacterium]
MEAVIFIGGDGPEPHLISHFLKNKDLVIAADSGLLLARQFSIPVDWVVGDMDSLSEPSLLEDFPPDRVLRYAVDKDYTDTELALQLAWKLGCSFCTLVGGGGGRTDHLLALAALFDRKPAPDRWITASDVLLRIDSTVELYLVHHSLVSIFPVGLGPWKAASTGLQWPLDAVQWERGTFGLSNRTTATPCTIRVESGTFLVIHPLNALQPLP